MMNLPSIQFGNLDVKLALEQTVLNVLDVKFGYFRRSVHAHSHSRGSYELHYIPAGQGTLVAAGQTYSLTPGSLFITGPGVVHEQAPHPDDPMAEYCIFFEVLTGDAALNTNGKRMPEECKLTASLLATPFWIGSDNGNMLQLFEGLAGELSMRQAGFHHMATNILEMIIVRTIRQYSGSTVSAPPAPQKKLDDKRLLIIENSFLHHYQSVTLGQLANQLGLSIRQTERMIHKQYGVSFQEKKLEARMGTASRLLATTMLAIQEIAAQSGFASPELFSKAFKKHFGMTATQYRSLNKRE